MEKLRPSQPQHLPLEILEEIALYLDRRSLLLFSLASKFCRLAAGSYLYREILLRIAEPVELEGQIARWEALLGSTSSISKVRSIKLLNNRVVGYGGFDATQQELHDRPDRRPPSAVYEHDSEWLPLATFLRRLPGLVDVVYGHSNQLPPCVLSAILAKPGCRLHMETFSLRSLWPDPPAPIIIDPYEKNLATAPCLHSITCRTAYYTRAACTDNNIHAIVDMVKGLAPHLAEVTVIPDFLSGTTERYHGQQKVWRGWEGAEMGVDSETFGKLTKLSLEDPGLWVLRGLREWSQRTDFSCLKMLELHGSVLRQELDWFATTCSLTSLRTLAMSIHTYRIQATESAVFHAAAVSFFDSLPPLKSLTISGDYDYRLAVAALSRCGSTLQDLALNTDLAECPLHEHLPDMAYLCPRLEELSIHVPRTQGDAKELAIYRSLGREFRRLERLYLTMECLEKPELVPALTSADADEDIVESATNPGFFFRAPDVRDALLNHALDEPLARSIFTTISQAKPQEPGVPPLEYLEVLAGKVAADVLLDLAGLPAGVRAAATEIERSWRCERNPRDDCTHECIVEEIDGEQREWSSSNIDEDLDDDVRPIFRSIWPGEGEWWEEWHSLPLSTSR